MQITVALLKRLAPTAKPARLNAIVSAAPRVLRKYEINTPLRMQHFFANLAHESGEFNIGRENVNYSAANLGKIWDSGNWRGYFPKRADLLKYAGRGEALLNIVYGNRMGNGPASSGDGYRYRGGGLAQITGKDGYATIGKVAGIDLVANPDLVFSDEYLLECAAAFWRWKKLALLADRDDFVAVCMKWNGAKKASSIIGMPDRKAKLALARKIFTDYLDVAPVGIMAQEVDAPEPAEPDADIPHAMNDDDVDDTPPGEVEAVDPDALNDFEPLAGSKGDARVYFAQVRLKSFHIPPGELDGKWGGATSSALARFVNDRKLTTLSAPTSSAEFDAAFPLLLPELRKAFDAGWTVDVTAARAAADPATVAKIAPESVPQKRNVFATIWLAISGAVLTAWNAVSSYAMAAWNWLTDNKDTGIVRTGQKILSEVPVGAWLALGTVVVAYLAYNALQANKISTEGVKTGERL